MEFLEVIYYILNDFVYMEFHSKSEKKAYKIHSDMKLELTQNKMYLSE